MKKRKLHTTIPVVCRSCSWYSARIDADGSCPTCGDGLRIGVPSVRVEPYRRAVAVGRFGDVSDETARKIDDALRKNREDARK